MLGEDLKPWLIEINCSPTMARCTAVTTDMCDSVLEDTCKVMIDRKYNRTADTGRFELIHKGTPVPVPIYVGIDLRVEGKTFKTGRSANNFRTVSPETQNNNTNNNNNTFNLHASAPSHMNSSSLSTSLSMTPAENRPVLAHSASALATHLQSSSSKSSSSPVSLKLRREMTQPTLTRIDVAPIADSSLEKLAASENYLFQFRSVPNTNTNIITNNTKSNQNQQADLRQRHLKVTPARLSVDFLPVRQITRTKVTNALPSPKGKKNTQTLVSALLHK
ncbi:unnamed protein product [Rotaria socialis]|uniref:Uncharacterized protein n=1 Tax=Rotaria socialis TaxID=392032 RepID=A0A821YVD3_9BILA|nr:unnamed protein product [Rotaria socialis]